MNLRVSALRSILGLAWMAGLLTSPLLGAALPERSWSRIWGSALDEVGQDVAVDPAGAAYVVGTTGGAFHNQQSAGENDFFLTKYRPDGTLVWTRIWGSTSFEEGRAVITEGTNAVYVAGLTWGDLAGQNNAGAADLVLCRLSPAGDMDWIRVWGSSKLDAAYGLALGPNGQLYVTGIAGASIDQQPYAGGRDIYVAQFTPHGQRTWSRMRGSGSDDYGMDITVDDAGRVYVAGYSYASIDQQPFSGSREACLLQYTTTGTWNWTRMWGQNGIDQANGVAPDRPSGVFVTGYGGAFGGQNGVGGTDPFLCRFKDNGDMDWARIWGSTGDDAALDVTRLGSNRLAVTGFTGWGSVFDGETNIYDRCFLTCFDTDSSKEGSRRWGNGDTEGHGIDASEAGDLYVAGVTYGGFDGEAWVGGNDAFLSRWTAPAPAVSMTNLYLTLGASSSRSLGIDVSGTVKRVEYFIDGEFLGTAYSAPFDFYIPPEDEGYRLATLPGNHLVRAIVHDGEDASHILDTTCTVSHDWAMSPVDISMIQPYRDYTLYTDYDVAPAVDLPIQVRAAETSTGVWSPPGFDVFWMVTHSNPVARVTFRVDGAVVGVSSNGMPGEPLVHEYLYNVAGLSTGAHHIMATASPSNGMPMAVTRSFQVEKRRPDLVFERTVTKYGSYFEVELTIENQGTSTAYLEHLHDTLIGLQGTVLEATFDHDVVYTYTPGAQTCALDITFTGPNALVAGNTVSLTYRALPILYHDVSIAYRIGTDAYVEYQPAGGSRTTEEILAQCTWVEDSAGGADILLSNIAVQRAFKEADFLLVTNPQNLFDIYDDTEVNRTLTTMAELGVLQNGVLGFFDAHALLRCTYRNGDLLATGNNFGGLGDEIYMTDLEENLLRSYSPSAEYTISERLPFGCAALPGDRLALANILPWAGTNVHGFTEMILLKGSGHGTDEGDIEAIQYLPDSATFKTNVFGTAYSEGYGFVVGDFVVDTDGAREEVIVIRPGDHTRLALAQIYRHLAFHDSFAMYYGAGDLAAAGPVTRRQDDQIVVGRVSSGQILTYDPRNHHPSTATSSIDKTLNTNDHMVVGDVWDDEKEEILLADVSEDRIYIYGFSTTIGNLERLGIFDVYLHPDDRITVGDVFEGGKEEIIIARGHSGAGYYEGEVEIYTWHGTPDAPTKRFVLDALIDEGGAWARALHDDWDEEGYLLLVGEAHILPAFTHAWNLEGNGRRVIRHTDIDYASTAGDDNRPELGTGRIIGNNATQLADILQTSVDLARGRVQFRNNRAFMVSGYRRSPDGESADIDFDSEVHGVRDNIEAQGFEVWSSGTEQAAPIDEESICDWGETSDVLFLSGHGGRTGWDILHRDEVFAFYHPTATRALVYANACLTGNYVPGTSIAEAFLRQGAAAYIGATEVSFGDVNERSAVDFFDRLVPGRYVGYAFKHGKRHRVGADTGDWRAYNQYNSAVYHLFGNPKLVLTSTGEGPALGAQAVGDPYTFQGPLSPLELKIPAYVVEHTNGLDRVHIPGQTMFTEPWHPAVPSYTVYVSYPAGMQVQNVILSERGGLQTAQGLAIPDFRPAERGAGNVDARQQSEWWPELNQDFAWTVDRDPGNKTTLILTVYPFYYNRKSTEVSFYTTYKFELHHSASSVEIVKVTTDRPTYEAHDQVTAYAYLRNTSGQPMDVICDFQVKSNRYGLAEALVPRQLDQLKGLGSLSVTWDSQGYEPGTYSLETEVRTLNGTVLDRDHTVFELGTAQARIVEVAYTPEQFRPGDTVALSATIENEGADDLSGVIVLLILDAMGETVAEFSGPFDELVRGKTHTFDTQWHNTDQVPRGCQIMAYVVYGGAVTASRMAGEGSEAVLIIDAIEAPAGQTTLYWPSVADRTYSVDYTPHLGPTPFAPVQTDLPATPPQNTYIDPVPHTGGCYRVREHW